MSRGNTAANTTESQAQGTRPLVFVEIQFDGGTLYLHNGIGRYEWTTPRESPAETWVGIGSLGTISDIEETPDLTPYRVSLTLNFTDPAIVAEVDDEELFERLVIIYLGYIDDAGALVADPDERWRGYMDSAVVDTQSITIQAETEMVGFLQANGKLFTDEDQQDDYSGDIGFEYLDQLIDADIRWGPNGNQVNFGGNGSNEPVGPVAARGGPGRAMDRFRRSR